MDKVIKQVGLQVKAAGLGARQLKFVISTGSVDRDNDTINPQGWALDAFRSNPIIPWGHDYSRPPIARAVSVGLEGGALVSVAEFPPAGIYELADQVYGLAKAGFIKGASVGFRPIEWQFNEARGPFAIDYKQQELLEWSVVSLPSNQEALIQAQAKGLSWPGLPGESMEYIELAEEPERELVEVDAQEVTRLVRATVQAALAQAMGTLDAGGRPRRVSPWPAHMGGATRLPSGANDAVVLTLADETPGERQRRLEHAAAVAFRGVDNSAMAQARA
jgi:uncharacterized protein